MAYQAILFDLFDTLVDFNFHKLSVAVNGKDRHFSSGVVFEALRVFHPEVEFEEFYEAFRAAQHELQARRAASNVEIPAPWRFNLMVDRLGLPSSEELLDRLVAAHFERMFEAMEFPPERHQVPVTLKKRFRLGLVSNFDHAPTAHRVLRHFDLVQYFDVIVISGEIGWRKPAPEIFAPALKVLEVAPEQVLFVGDSPEHDLAGPKRLGMGAAWLNRAGQPLPPGIPPPEFEIRQLEDLSGVLQR
jgi:HAD superfamily hydrolase (TIGR01549 family)